MYVCTNMGYELTNDELIQLGILMDTLKVDTKADAPVWTSKPLLRKREEALPLEHEAASESFLVAEMEGRCVLSAETRLMEEERLQKRSRKRKKYRLRGRYHHRSKAATKRRKNREKWEKHPLRALRATFRQGVDIREDEWQRLIEPAWSQHPTGVLKAKSPGGKPMNVYTMLLVDGEGRVWYDGPSQAVTDVQDVRYTHRVLELTGNKKAP